MLKKSQINEILDILAKTYPQAQCALEHQNIFQLLVAVCLSAQTTDKSVNKVTPALFKKYPDPLSLSLASVEEVSEFIKTLGMYKTKAKNLVGLGQSLTSNFNGIVPLDYHALITLPGVGRKTANVVLSVGFGEERIAVDTHVFRLANRIGLVNEKNVLKTELSLMKVLPKNRWTSTHHALIFHGRECCHAKKPQCVACPIESLCQFNDKNI